MNRRRKQRLKYNAAVVTCGIGLCLGMVATLPENETDLGEVEVMHVYAAQGARPSAYPFADASGSTPVIVRQEFAAKTEKSGSVVGSAKWSDSEKYLLEKIAMAEAEGEDTVGKAYIMRVVLNRVQSDGFPNGIEEVILQSRGSTYQFSSVMPGGRWWTTEPDQDCRNAMEMIENGWDESHGALFFESESDSEWHRKNLRFLFRHGRHYFYTEK